MRRKGGKTHKKTGLLRVPEPPCTPVQGVHHLGMTASSFSRKKVSQEVRRLGPGTGYNLGASGGTGSDLQERTAFQSFIAGRRKNGRVVAGGSQVPGKRQERAEVLRIGGRRAGTEDKAKPVLEKTESFPSGDDYRCGRDLHSSCRLFGKRGKSVRSCLSSCCQQAKQEGGVGGWDGGG